MRLEFEKSRARAQAEPVNRATAFTLIEVMIASAIFFMCMFAVLGLMSQGLKAARILKRDAPTVGMVASEFFALSATNKVEEGSDSGDFGEFYSGYRWTRQCDAISNGLYQVTITVTHNGTLDSALSTYLYDAKSANRMGRFR